MAGSICIINNSYHETFFMKFSPVLSAIRAGNKGANIEKVRVCLACKCNAPTSHCQASDRCSEERRGLHCSAVQLEHISHAKCGSQSVVCEGRLSRSVPWVLQAGMRSLVWPVMQHWPKTRDSVKGWTWSWRTFPVLVTLCSMICDNRTGGTQWRGSSGDAFYFTSSLYNAPNFYVSFLAVSKIKMYCKSSWAGMCQWNHGRLALIPEEVRLVLSLRGGGFCPVSPNIQNVRESKGEVWVGT